MLVGKLVRLRLVEEEDLENIARLIEEEFRMIQSIGVVLSSNNFFLE